MKVYLFEVFEVNRYIYRGQVKLVEEPYQEKQKAEDGVLRNVWIFPVKSVDNHEVTIDKEIIDNNFYKKERRQKNYQMKNLKKKLKRSKV